MILRDIAEKETTMNARKERLLRIAFLTGAITDAGALLPMIFPSIAGLLWGFRETTGPYRFAMGYGSALMLGWTVLLLWAYRRPMDRRFVAVLTIIVVCGLIIAEVIAVHSGVFPASRMIPTWCLQVVLLSLFAGAYFYSASVEVH
jgi:hypothetical protein